MSTIRIIKISIQYINIKLDSIQLDPHLGYKIQHSTVCWQDLNHMEIDFIIINLNIFAIVCIAADDIKTIRNQIPIVYKTMFIQTNN